MFVCLEGHLFEEPKRWEETHGFDHGPFERFSGCPYCGEPYAETYECDECGHWITGEYIKTSTGHRICEHCYTTYEIGEE